MLMYSGRKRFKQYVYPPSVRKRRHDETRKRKQPDPKQHRNVVPFSFSGTACLSFAWRMYLSPKPASFLFKAKWNLKMRPSYLTGSLHVRVVLILHRCMSMLRSVSANVDQGRFMSPSLTGGTASHWLLCPCVTSSFIWSRANPPPSAARWMQSIFTDISSGGTLSQTPAGTTYCR